MKLLVSARNAEEVSLLQSANVDIIDLKEPHLGSLGKVSAGDLGKVNEVVSSQDVLSVAYGELFDWNTQQPLEFVRGQQFAKIGMAHLDNPNSTWRRRWTDWMEHLPTNVRPVGVIYADYESCQAPAPFDVIDEAYRRGCPVVLIDTFDKTNGDLFDQMRFDHVSEIVDTIHLNGMQCALAGSLTEDKFHLLDDLQPDIVAVRGSVCFNGDRRESICQHRVESLKQKVVRLNQEQHTADV